MLRKSALLQDCMMTLPIMTHLLPPVWPVLGLMKEGGVWGRD